MTHFGFDGRKSNTNTIAAEAFVRSAPVGTVATVDIEQWFPVGKVRRQHIERTETGITIYMRDIAA
jgi:hypothetical protein